MRNEHLNVSHPDRLSVLTSRAERESRNLMVVENQSPNPTHQCELFFLRTTIAGGSLIPPPLDYPRANRSKIPIWLVVLTPGSLNSSG